MPPKLNGIDHVHVYVSDRDEAAKWYQEILGFAVIEKYKFWADDDQGPLIIEDASGTIHLALFQRENFTPGAALAFGVDGENFLVWKAYLEQQGLLDSLSDHTASWSIYFKDPYGNSHEITTYQHDYVASQLS